MSSAVTNLWRQFVQRRLWPVAILLIAALAAVPLVLGEEPASPAPAPPVPVTGTEATGELAAQPIVAQAAVRTKRRKVLGSAKNPFGVPPKDEPSDASSDVADVGTQQTGQNSDAGSGGAPSTGGGSTPGTTTPSAPVAPGTPVAPATPAPEPKTYARQELTVRFGPVDSLDRRSVERLQPLPSAEEPVLIYLGLLKDGKTAVFLVDQGVEPVGDGECRPTPEQCETIRLRAGETEFFDVKDETGAVTGEYQLDLLKIHNPGGSATAARASASSKAVARLLKARVAGPAARGSVLRSTVGRSSARLP